MEALGIATVCPREQQRPGASGSTSAARRVHQDGFRRSCSNIPPHGSRAANRLAGVKAQLVTDVLTDSTVRS